MRKIPNLSQREVFTDQNGHPVVQTSYVHISSVPELVDEVSADARSGGAQRVTDGDRPAARVELWEGRGHSVKGFIFDSTMRHSGLPVQMFSQRADFKIN